MSDNLKEQSDKLKEQDMLGMSELTKTSQQIDTQEGKYVYAIVESAGPKSFGKIGIGGQGEEVYMVNYDGLSAVVSNSPLVVYDPTRENVMNHERVIEAVMREFPVIPMSFGTLFKTDQDVTEFLKHTSHALHEVLDKMKGKIEFGLKVSWEPEAIIKEVEQDKEEIRKLKEQISKNSRTSTYFARLQLGRLVEQAIEERKDGVVKNTYDELRSYAVASRQNKPIGDKMILNAAFLVEREKLAEFQQRVDELSLKSGGKLRFVLTGPWPPYNFVNIRLKLEGIAPQ